MNDYGQYAHVVFDWNGTVIDDFDLAVRSVNRVRTAEGLEEIDHSTYRRLFRFPIVEFYRDIGFDFRATPFDVLVASYLLHFDAEVGDCALCDGFHELVEILRAAGSRLAILSASHQQTLVRTAQRLQVADKVDHIFGLDDSAASGKIARARELDRRLEREPGARVLLIGDTDHDYAVAVDRNWDFIAVASGHQSRLRLTSLGVPVFDRLSDLAAHFCAAQTQSKARPAGGTVRA
ncbi:HAD family hydrolase [Ensifer adhaerens]|uniref:HAD family hydrolase n=1 Tax=Ensifer adhaerens TaxID=106592 RepID=UPI00131A259B|nr:HAD hydrolase-like protein [Ensifer adhaerens]